MVRYDFFFFGGGGVISPSGVTFPLVILYCILTTTVLDLQPLRCGILRGMWRRVEVV